MRKIVVTGGSRGIGAGIVSAFAKAGDTVILHYNTSVDAATTLQQQLGAQVHCVKADLTDAAAVDAMFLKIHKEIGQIDVLVNNAGVSLTCLFQDTSISEMQAVMDVNFFGACRCITHVLPDMIFAKKGCIINISSIWGEVGASCESIYAASKAALIGLTKSLSKELAPCGIRVNAIAPGVVMTDMLAQYSMQELEDLTCEIPLQRLATPEEVASAALYLSSRDASYITGQVLRVNGGLHI